LIAEMKIDLAVLDWGIMELLAAFSPY
jgi:hypothetical protein